jgi:hypothetical protein
MVLDLERRRKGEERGREVMKGVWYGEKQVLPT